MTSWIAALLLDALAGEPPEVIHPVVWMGRFIDRLTSHAPAGPRAQLFYGVGIASLPAAGAAALARVARALPTPVARGVGTVWLLGTAFSLRALLDRADEVSDALSRGATSEAREALRHLVSRDREDLDEDHVASAAIESLAENLTDSYVAPLMFYLLGGPPLALAYRAVNTADAMVGYHGKYEHLGKAAARVDDVLSYIPARLAAGAIVAAAPLVRLDARQALATARGDASLTESPNAGWTMAAAAGALGVRLEKVGHYELGGGRAPHAEDVIRARDLILAAACLVTAAVTLLRR